MSTAHIPDPNRRNPQATAAILEAALSLAMEVGLARTSIEGIAARAGVGKRTIYRWWPSKGVVVLDAFAQRLDETLYKRLDTAQSDDFEADLRLAIKDVWLHIVGNYLPVARSLLGEAQHDPALAAEFRTRLIDPATERVAARIRAAQAAGQVAPHIDPYRAIELIYGQLYYRLLITHTPQDATYCEDVATLALHGLHPR